ncbi:MAG: sugar transporter permease [Bacilli bacterium]|jgi:ribose/xylose/arabinose/galactoside ABC-type transport system permease subunit|nr:sugar transporter permease [Bacilli bacterium]
MRLQTMYRRILRSKIVWPLMGLALIMLFNLFFNTGFFEIQIHNGHLFGLLIDILNRGTPLIIISLGMTLVIAKGGIDISVGSVVAISACLSAYLLQQHVPFWAALAAGLAAGVICGCWNGMLVAKMGIQPMVATLILMTVGRGIAMLITGGQIITISNVSYKYIGSGFLFGIQFAIILALVLFILLFLLMRRTALGLFLEAIGVNRVSSAFAGIRSRRIMFFVYVISGFCAALSGIIISSNITGADANYAGLWIELDAILAVVIGGTSMQGGRFYLGGTLVGALFIQSLQTTIYTLGVKPESVMVVKAIVVILVSLLQSEQFRSKLIHWHKKANVREAHTREASI